MKELHGVTEARHDPGLAVLDLITARRRANSLPGRRTDGARLAIVLEGGSSRAAYAAGMGVAIEQLGLLPCVDAVYGSSAGTLNAAWLLTGAAHANVHVSWDGAVMRRVIEPRRILRGLPVIDTDYLVDTVYREVAPLDVQAILASPVTFHPLATDVDTGECVDLHPVLTDEASVRLALRASTRLPIIGGPPVVIDGRRFIDSGVTESVPVHTALRQGATHLLVLRSSRIVDLPLAPSRTAQLERRLVSRYLSRTAPATLRPWLERQELREREERVLEEHPAVLQVRPPAHAAWIGRTCRDSDLLRQAVVTGRAALLEALGTSHTEVLPGLLAREL